MAGMDVDFPWLGSLKLDKELSASGAWPPRTGVP
jgi:hypothetical protein